MLRGAWNAQTVPQAYGGPWSALWLPAVIVALTAYFLLARPRHRWPGLGVAAVAGLVIAALGVTVPGRDLLRSLITAWPGFAVLRDAQQYVAPLALAESVGFGLAVTAALNPGPFGRKSLKPERPSPARTPASPSEHLARAGAPGAASARPAPADAPGTAPERPIRADPAGTIIAVLALLVPVLLLPGL